MWYVCWRPHCTTVESLRSRLSGHPDNTELREVMSDLPLMLSVAISGWHNNVPAREFYKTVYGLRHVGDSLTGVFRIYTVVLDILVNLVRDGYSSIIFKSILDALGQDKVKAMDWEQPYNRILDQVTVRLQSDGAIYFVARSRKRPGKFVSLLSSYRSASCRSRIEN